MVDFVNSV